MALSDRDDVSMFRRERWPNLFVSASLFLFFAWFSLPPLLLGFAAVWPFRKKVVTLFRARRRWERELAIGFSGFMVGIIIFTPPYLFLVQHYVWQR